LQEEQARAGAFIPWAAVAEFFAALQEAFQDVDDVEAARAELRQLKQQVAVRDYIDKFRITIRRIPGFQDDSEGLDRFVEGLRPHVKAQVCIVHPRTLRAAYTAALDVERANTRAVGVTATPSTTAPGAEEPPAADQADPVAMELDAIGMGKGPCWLCNEPGHWRSSCPNLGQVRCQLCGRLGHGAPRCPRATVIYKAVKH
jgi:hypothetical protein